MTTPLGLIAGRSGRVSAFSAGPASLESFAVPFASFLAGALAPSARRGADSIEMRRRSRIFDRLTCHELMEFARSV